MHLLHHSALNCKKYILYYNTDNRLNKQKYNKLKDAESK